MRTKELIKENAEKQQLLTKENEAFYGDILLYVRSSAVDEHSSEEILLDILNHILEAQQHGKSAREVIGDHPKEYCDELLAHLPKAKWKDKMQYAMLILRPLLMFVIPCLVSGEFSFTVFNVVLFPLFSGLAIYTFFWSFKKESFSVSKYKMLYSAVPFICFFLALSMLFLHEIWHVSSIPVGEFYAKLMGGILLILIIGYSIKMKFWDSVLFLFCLVGIAISVEFGLISDTIAAAILIGGLLLYPFLSKIILQKQKI